MLSCKGSKEDFIDAFVEEKCLYSPFNQHVLEFWKIRDQPNILLLFFEDMKRNLPNEVNKVMKFLGRDFTQSQIEELCEHLSFESMKKNPAVNKEDEVKSLKEAAGEEFSPEDFSFIRKGKIGAYKEELSAEEIKKLETYMDHPEFDKFNFSYKF